MKKNMIIILLAATLFACTATKKEVLLESPDKQASITIGVDPSTDGQLTFAVNYQGDRILNPSPIEMIFSDSTVMGKGLKITSTESKEINETWERVIGKSKKVLNQCNETTIGLKETTAPFRKYILVARAYNDGIAFRYLIPEQENLDSIFIGKENTTFNFAKDYEVWATTLQGFVSSQERPFDKKPISKIKEKNVTGTPLLIKLDKGWAALLEANLTDWAGMFITSGKDGSSSVKTLLSPLPGNSAIAVKTKTPAQSPWRVLMLSAKPGGLIESNLLHNLSEPNKIEDPSWIVPGRSAWDCWWSGGYAPGLGHPAGYDQASMKYYIDLASEMGWEYQTVDWIWYGNAFKVLFKEPNPDSDVTKSAPELDIPALAEYAKSKNVKLLLWMHYWHADRQMEEAFATYEKWGIAGVKIDFMNRNDQEMVNFYHRVLKKAAEHKLIVDFHGAYMPTGEDRTYPNLLTREGISGNEASKWGNKISPEHCVTIPFTRMLGGGMDFTPGGFRHAPFGKFVASGMDTPNPWVQGTRCFQLAMPVIYESPLTTFCDSPDSYRGQAGIEFYKVVPTNWDESKVIDGMPGEFIVMARRHTNDWFLGAMTNDLERSIDIPLDFLGEGKYKATIFADAADVDVKPENLVKTEVEVDSTTSLKANLAKGGGYAVHFDKIQ